MSGQSIMDRVTAAKHSIAGQGLAKTVCKATTEELMGPKRKHLDYLLQCTNEPNVSIPHLADLLIERTQNQSWVIVYKSLITIQNLMNYGNERFTQYLASNNCSFNLSSFIDKTGVQGYDMSTFIRRYAKYLNEKALTYRLMAFDFCKVKRGREDGLLRTMNTEKLLKTLPVLQKQIDALLEFDCSANELTNGVINAGFMLLFKDLIRLFACYNDGTINLLEKYFDMNKKNCKEALDIYKKFLVRMDKVSEFLKTAENVGIDKGDIPDLAKGLKGNNQAAPASLLDALEQHLQSMEGKKGNAIVAPPPKPSGFNTAINAIAGNSSIQVTEEDKKKILEEESQQLQQLKNGIAADQMKESHQEPEVVVDLLGDQPQEQKARESASAASPSQAPATTNNPFTSQPPPASTAQNASPLKPSDDLLNLNENPFVQNVQNVMQMTQGTNAFGAPAWGQVVPPPSGGFQDTGNFANFTNGQGGGSSMMLDVSMSTPGVPLTPSPTTVALSQPSTMIAPESPAKDIFTGGDAFSTNAFSADTFQSEVFPTSDNFAVTETDQSGFDAFGEIMQPNSTPTKTLQTEEQKKLDNKDLDSNLAMLAGNIAINGADSVKKPQHQWQPKTDQKKTGGDSWATQPVIPASTTWAQPTFQPQPVRPAMMGYGQPGMQQPMMQPGMMPMGGMPQQPMMTGMAPMPGMAPMGQPQMYGMRPGMQPVGMMPQQQPQQTQPNDPFGAL